MKYLKLREQEKTINIEIHNQIFIIYVAYIILEMDKLYDK